MNRERAKELLPIIEAYANGKDIQFMPNQYNPEDVDCPTWSDLPKDELLTITFPCPDYSYRIKPSPREFWIWDTKPILGTGSGMVHWSDGQPFHEKHAIKVREVL